MIASPLPDRIPTLPLRDLVFFPSMVLPLLVGRSGSLAALQEAERSGDDPLLLLVSQHDADVDEPSAEDLHRIGTVARVLQSTALDDGTARVVFEGISRVEVVRFQPGPGPLRAKIASLPHTEADVPLPPELKAMLRRTLRAFREYVQLHPDLPSDLGDSLSELDAPDRLAYRIAGHLIVEAAEKQSLLEASTLEKHWSGLQRILEREREVLQIEAELEGELGRKIDADRRRHYLQEQLRVIQGELGDDDAGLESLQLRLREAELPQSARDRAEQELDRLKRLSTAAPESGVIRTYLDWILSLPWSERTSDQVDVARARSVLEEAHFGLEEVKDRILDHIAVLSLAGELKGPILCLVGAPGVGKTSLGRSIAEALGRRFVRVALGGIRDDAEIRGHRRTYVGSLPGRILQGIRRAGTRNPVFLLDEVDKLARDAQGDPASALLEVLDPEQNRTFQDLYLELEFDLSEVLFVATANTLSEIPDPLRDRMEIIRIPGYLDGEKRSIARGFLLPEQLRRHGLSVDRVTIPEEVLVRIIEDYTREAGVRELDRLLARVARKTARSIAEGRTPLKGRTRIEAEHLRELLGPPPHVRPHRDSAADRIGIATGLAWTSAGGEVLEVEASVVPGNGAIQLTGALGDIMKESAVAALTFSRARYRELGLQHRFHQDVDVHVHIPEGATPKDGPSAGVTIAAALISALTGAPTPRDVAMTGEITLRGRILPVGGIKEKAVAALREGIETIIVPAGNGSELELLPEVVRDQLTIRTVERMDEVLDQLFSRGNESRFLRGGPMGEVAGTYPDPGTRMSQ